MMSRRFRMISALLAVAMLGTGVMPAVRAAEWGDLPGRAADGFEFPGTQSAIEAQPFSVGILLLAVGVLVWLGVKADLDRRQAERGEAPALRIGDAQARKPFLEIHSQPPSSAADDPDRLALGGRVGVGIRF